ncbi:MAG TPA: DedA family protein [Planctomycetota bacterium]|nr:DedA family protein [Planctomycetota bacterium]
MNSLDMLLDLVRQYKYAAMFGVLFCCGLGLPLPEEVILIASGLAVGWADVDFSWSDFAWSSVACVLGILAGDSVIFGLGRYRGRWFLSSRPMRWLMTEKRQAKIHRLFAKHGRKAVFFARFLAGVRIGVYAYAGQHGMSWRRFLFLDLLGALISGPTSIAVGAYAARKIADPDQAKAFARKMIHEGSHWVYAALALAVLLILVHWLWSRRRAARTSAPRAAARDDTVIHARMAAPLVPPPEQAEDPSEAEASFTTSGQVHGTTDRGPPPGGAPRSPPRSP